MHIIYLGYYCFLSGRHDRKNVLNFCIQIVNVKSRQQKVYWEGNCISYNDKAFFILICISALKKKHNWRNSIIGVIFFFCLFERCFIFSFSFIIRSCRKSKLATIWQKLITDYGGIYHSPVLIPCCPVHLWR